MATRYSDIITLSKSRTVYNIREEGPHDWESFIANDQFNSLLDKAVKAVFNNDLDNHKSIWMAGTYGSGKSHAGAVIKHLLCDAKEDIMRYVDLEYGAPKYAMLRSNLLAMRDCKRLFPVNMYGQQSITHEDDLSLQLQREIKSSLEAAGIHIKVKTDFDTYVEHIGQNPEFWQMLIERSPKLASLAPNIDKLAADLAACDPGVLDKVNTALRENRFDVRMDSKNLVNWIIEVQNKLREGGVYNGLLIVWDEFTEIATSPAIGVKLLERLQEISDTLMSPEHDSYFLLISHPSALNALNEQKRNQTIGRYHYFTYNMETVSAFKIMSCKFNILDTEAHTKLVDEFYGSHPGLLEIYSATSNQPEETKSDLKKLYPLHPATADLATHYAREAGSSSRSVFEFLACDAVRAFFDNELLFNDYATITADYLWDYVREGKLAFADNLGDIVRALEAGALVEVGPHVPATNQATLQQLADMGVSRVWLSPELTLGQVADLAQDSPVPLGLIVAGAQELMITEHCLLMSQGPCNGQCETCPRRAQAHFLRDRKGYDFPVVTDMLGRSHLYNGIELDAVPTLPDLLDIGISAVMVDTTLMSKQEAEAATARAVRALDLARAEHRAVQKRPNTTTGHLFRGVS